MKKYILDLKVKAVERLSEKHVLLKLTDVNPLPEMLPGQFVEVRVDSSSSTFLRRPISINFVDRTLNELWLMVAMVGDGTRQLGHLQVGDTLNCVLPLGHGFSVQSDSVALPLGHGFSVQSDSVALPLVNGFSVQSDSVALPSQGSETISSQGKNNALQKMLLVGGGVGVAPLLYLGAELKAQGCEVTFLLGGRSAKDVL